MTLFLLHYHSLFPPYKDQPQPTMQLHPNALAIVMSLAILVVSHSVGRSDTPESVSVSTSKSGFVSSAIVPEVLGAFNPLISFFQLYHHFWAPGELNFEFNFDCEFGLADYV